MSVGNNSANANVNLVGILPEIIQRISSFLPNKDLLSCTLVNSTWEKEARNHLLIQTTPRLHTTLLANYLQTMASTSHRHRRFALSYSWGTSAEFFQLLEIFCTATHSTTTKLELSLPLGQEMSNILHMLLFLPNLNCLELLPRWSSVEHPTHLDHRSAVLALNELIPEKLLFSNVTALRFGMQWLIPFYKEVEFTIISRILPLFPNLTKLQLRLSSFSDTNRITEFLFVQKNAILTKLTDLYISSICSLESVSSHNFVNLTGLSISCGFGKSFMHSKVLKAFAPLLEKLEIILVMNLGSSVIDEPMVPLIVPIMPRLRIFKIFQSQSQYTTPQRNILEGSRVFKFETQTPANGNSIVYPAQFPVLRKLVVSGNKGVLGVPRRDAEDRLMELVAPYIYSVFLGEGNSPCLTLTELDLLIPQWVEFKLPVTEGEDKGLGYEMVQSWKYLNRIITTFPNIKYQVLFKKRLEFRKTCMDKWLQMGADLGLLLENQSGHEWNSLLIRNPSADLM